MYFNKASHESEVGCGRETVHCVDFKHACLWRHTQTDCTLRVVLSLEVIHLNQTRISLPTTETMNVRRGHEQSYAFSLYRVPVCLCLCMCTCVRACVVVFVCVCVRVFCYTSTFPKRRRDGGKRRSISFG